MRIDQELLQQIISFIKNNRSCFLDQIEFADFKMKEIDFYSPSILEMKKESIVLYHVDFLIEKKQLKICA